MLPLYIVYYFFPWLPYFFPWLSSFLCSLTSFLGFLLSLAFLVSFTRSFVRSLASFLPWLPSFLGFLPSVAFFLCFLPRLPSLASLLSLASFFGFPPSFLSWLTSSFPSLASCLFPFFPFRPSLAFLLPQLSFLSSSNHLIWHLLITYLPLTFHFSTPYHVPQCLRPGSAPEDEATTSEDLGKMVAGLNARYAREGGRR